MTPVADTVVVAARTSARKRQGAGSADALRPFAGRLVALMTDRGFSQQALADRLGLTRASVSDWCRGKSIPAPDTVFAAEEALEVAPGELSRELGYLPVAAIGATSSKPTVIEGIDTDPRLDDYARRLLKMIYGELAGSASRRRRRRS